MMRRIAIIVFFFLVSVSGNEVKLSIPSRLNDKSSLVEDFMRMYRFRSKDGAFKVLYKRLLFAQAYLKHYGLSNEDRNRLTILLINYLDRLYKKRLIKNFEPSQKELYSYYILHKKDYPEGFEKSKRKIKKKLLAIKSFQVFEREYERLANKRN